MGNVARKCSSTRIRPRTTARTRWRGGTARKARFDWEILSGFSTGFRLITGDVSSGGIVHKIKIFNSAETSRTNWCCVLSILGVCSGLFPRVRINYRLKCKRCQVTRTFFILSYFLFLFCWLCDVQILLCVYVSPRQIFIKLLPLE